VNGGDTIAATRLAWLFGWRYLRARRRARFVSFTALSAIGGLALGIAVLITVLSIMNGFGDALRGRILGTVPHVTVMDGREAATVPALLAQLQSIAAAGEDGITGIAPFFEGQGMLMHQGNVLGVGLFGIDPALESRVSIVPAHMVRGQLQALRAVPDGVVLGEPLAFHLGIVPGDRVTLLVPVPDGRGGVRPVLLSLQLVGTFQVDAEVDYQLALIDWRHAEALGIAAAGRFGARVRTDDVLAAGEVAARLRAALPGTLRVEDWGARFGELFAAVGMEKAMMGALLGLVVAIASFNVVSTLVMLVDDKRADIAVLRTLGAAKQDVGRIFLVHGALIAGIGLVIGIAGGVALANGVTDIVRGVEWLFDVRLLQGTYFTSVPSTVLPGDIAIVAALGAVVSLAAAIYPARRAAALDPVQGLHQD
jgi:lipoprotein-releasing system permease protein